jgi:exodeoxyribonuclease VII small subunit
MTHLSAPGTYEAAVELIETEIAHLERGDMPLVQLFEEFEQAVESLRQCEEFLQARQTQVELLIETLADS